MATFEEIEDLKNRIVLGEMLRYLNTDPKFVAFKTSVLDKIRADGYESYLKIKADDTVSIIETQMVAKVVDTVYKRLNTLISEGELAKMTLTQLEEEHNG